MPSLIGHFFISTFKHLLLQVGLRWRTEKEVVAGKGKHAAANPCLLPIFRKVTSKLGPGWEVCTPTIACLSARLLYLSFSVCYQKLKRWCKERLINCEQTKLQSRASLHKLTHSHLVTGYDFEGNLSSSSTRGIARHCLFASQTSVDSKYHECGFP
jgi:hypothetical protein